AQAQGKSLGEHLEEAPLDDDDLEEIDEEDAAAEALAAAERAALRAAIEAKPLTLEGPADFDGPPTLEDGAMRPTPASMPSASLDQIRAAPSRRRTMVLVGVLGVVAIGGVATWKVMQRSGGDAAAVSAAKSPATEESARPGEAKPGEAKSGEAK